MTQHLWFLLAEAADRLSPTPSEYRIIWEDPDDIEAPAKVTTPDPNWMSAALEGNILPPIECYWRDALRGNSEPKEHPYADPIGPMTELEAIEYLIKKDIPPRVWMDGNRLRFRIVRADQVPADRSHRNAWELAA